MPVPRRPIAVLLMAMGGPDRLENVEAYLKDVRGGRPTAPELVEEIRERYRVTGGKSPVLGIMREVAYALEQRLNRSDGERYRCYVGLRHWHPFIKETYAQLLDDVPERVVGFCMAPQYSSLSIGAYMKKVEEARAESASEVPISFVTSWHRHPLLIAGIADNIGQTLQKFPADVRPHVPVLFTAHSLPERVVVMKDPYPEEVAGTVEAVCAQLGARPTRFAYQSQGRSGEKWLGPSVEETVAELAQEGHRHVLVAPIGFICDHVETLYDIDIELKQLAQRKGMHLERIPMLNASASLIDIVTSIIEAHESSLVH
ncbi:MAG: Coproporphyrin ferrochelatase [Nitrospira sp.]|jgi:ferrochelatase|nr:MAG: Coproporphyrin ferrochelatase [Nitrospira sp.]